jgi:hypothetical protein
MTTKLYAEEHSGSDLTALIKVLGCMGIVVIRSLPTPAEACYVLVDIERRRQDVNNWLDAWYAVRADLNVRATLIGLVTDKELTPVPGAYPIRAWNALPELLNILSQIPKAISPELLAHQTQSSRHRQTDRLIHDLRFLVAASGLSSEEVHRRLTTTQNAVIHSDLRSLLAELINEVDQSLSRESLEYILKRQLTTLEDER